MKGYCSTIWAFDVATMTSLKTHHENGDDNEAHREQVQIVWKIPLLKID